MNKIFSLAFAMLISSTAFAATDHYILREGNHVHHLKITTLADDILVSADVDFEPNKGEENTHPCSADISGKAKKTGENEITLKQQAEGKSHFCSLKITLSNTGAKIDQSEGCTYFAAGICHFTSEGKELIKIK